jgi:hypothetical protein
MRLFAILAVLLPLVGLGGCFHHQQVVSEPTTLPPLK